MRVLVCLDPQPAADGSCAQTAFIEQPALIPEMTVEQGREIGHAFLLAVIAVAVIKTFLSPKLHRKS
jgi:ABC-type uncharacterized transport system permease subunit